jgi:hypothetical protein
LLDPEKAPQYYYDCSKTLFWMVISVASRRYVDDLTLFTSICTAVPRLLWTNVQRIPQNHHFVKALCLVCYWPFPISSTSSDPTFMLSGVMKHLALQCGLKRPGFARDFSKTNIDMTQEEFEDRSQTWVVCNTVAQSISTAYGQPQITSSDWTIEQALSPDGGAMLPPELTHRFLIEKLVDEATSSLYCSVLDPSGICPAPSRSNLSNMWDSKLQELDNLYNTSNITKLQLLGARLHIQACALFDDQDIQTNLGPLSSVYDLCQKILTLSHTLDGTVHLFAHCSQPVVHILLATAFTLLTLLSSSFTEFVDQDAGKKLYNSAVIAIRKISVTNNDLPARLAEVLAQMWRRPELRTVQIYLSVRCRMSASVMYSSLWTWRDLIQSQEHEDPSAAKPTKPEFVPNSDENPKSGRNFIPTAPNAGYANTAQAPTASTGGLIESQLGQEPSQGQYNTLNMLLDGMFVEYPR